MSRSEQSVSQHAEAGSEQIGRLLAARHSLKQTERIAWFFGGDAVLFAALMQYFLGSDPLLAQRAAWVLSTVGCRHPQLLHPWWKRILKRIQAPCHDALRRNVLKVLETTGVPESISPDVLDLCLRWLSDRSQPIAVHAYALSIVHAQAQRYPELMVELRAVVELLREQASPGIRSRLRKLGL
jgi:hypothetical protein